MGGVKIWNKFYLISPSIIIYGPISPNLIQIFRFLCMEVMLNLKEADP